MILFLQYTITDSRYFSSHQPELLNKPHWPSPKPFGEFVRSAGPIIERNKQGLSSWVGENFICRIRNGIRFPKRVYLSNGTQVNNIAKHLYASEHYVLTKYEFVFNIKLPGGEGKVGYDLLKVLVNELLSTSVNIKIGQGYEQIKLSQLARKLLQFHYENTTANEYRTLSTGFVNLVACTPQLYFYLDKNERIVKLSSNYKKIANISNIADLYGAWHDHKNNPFRIWVHHRIKRTILVTENRELRMTIMRLHSEYECLKNLFGAISKGLVIVEKRSPLSDALQSYFNTAIRTFLYDESDLEFKSWTKNFFNYFSKIFTKASPGELERIRYNIQQFEFRRNIENKTINFIEKIEFVENKFENSNSTILSQGNNNDVHNNQLVQNVGTSTTQIDFKELLKQLSLVLEKAQQEATTTDQRKSIVALSEAEDAAKKNDRKGVIAALKTGGKWMADVASKLTATIVVELIKAHTTLLS